MLKMRYLYDVKYNMIYVCTKNWKNLLFRLPDFDKQVPDFDQQVTDFGHSESFLRLDSLVGYFYGSFPYCFHAVCVSIQQYRDDPW